MVTKTNEQALEAAIQRTLTGSTVEKITPDDVAETPADYIVENNGFKLGYLTTLMRNTPSMKSSFGSFSIKPKKTNLKK